MTICERIKNVRMSENLSQPKFGEKLGVSRDVVANIEYGRVAPKELFINAVCNTFNINKEWLLNGTGEMYLLPEEDEILTKAFAEIALSNNEKLKELVRKLVELDEKYIDSLNVILDGIIDEKK